MKLETRILLSIKQRSGNVILRREIAELGSPSQVTTSLNHLINKGAIVRVSSGIYVKSKKDAVTGVVSLLARSEDVAEEAFLKLGVKVKVAKNISANSPTSPTLEIDIGSHRINRHLALEGQAITYKRQQPESSSLNKTLQIPKEGVSQFVERLADKHHISYKRTAGDAWAESVTQLAGDEVISDTTGDLLVALKRAHKLNDGEMTALLINHLREKRHV